MATSSAPSASPATSAAWCSPPTAGFLAALSGEEAAGSVAAWGGDLAAVPPAGYVVAWDGDLAPDSAVKVLCSANRQALTPEEWARYLPEYPYRRTCS